MKIPKKLFSTAQHGAELGGGFLVDVGVEERVGGALGARAPRPPDAVHPVLSKHLDNLSPNRVKMCNGSLTKDSEVF